MSWGIEEGNREREIFWEIKGETRVKENISGNSRGKTRVKKQISREIE